ncbi:hypothetical protein FHU14_000118 [Mesorhizobium sp. RMAD-H1]|nr:hypothetical protein [Mesorhizobium sp. RMAD-H1]
MEGGRARSTAHRRMRETMHSIAGTLKRRQNRSGTKTPPDHWFIAAKLSREKAAERYQEIAGCAVIPILPRI